MYLKKYINFNIFKFNFSISQHVVCLHLFDLFTYLISLHWKIESEITGAEVKSMDNIKDFSLEKYL